MRRRSFLMGFGSSVSVLSGTRIAQKPTVAADFNISTVEKANPSDLVKAIVHFTDLRITPFFMDESRKLEITSELDFGGEYKSSKKAYVEFDNGEAITLSKIRDRSGKDLSMLTVSNLDESMTPSTGNCAIKVRHPEISEQSYRQLFNINKGKTVVESFENGSLSSYSGDTSRNDVTNTRAFNGNYSIHLNDSNGGFVYRTGGQTVSQGDTIKVRMYPNSTGRGNDIQFYWGTQGSSDRGYILRMDEAGTKYIGLSRYSNGSRTNLDSSTISPDTDGWNTFKIDWRSDGFIKVYFNGSSILEGSDTTFESGGIGFRQWGNSPDTWFDHVTKE